MLNTKRLIKQKKTLEELRNALDAQLFTVNEGRRFDKALSDVLHVIKSLEKEDRNHG